MDNMIRLYKNHGDKIGYWQGWTDGPWVNIEYAAGMDAKPVVSTYMAMGKNRGRTNETSPADQAILEIQAKARLKRDKGYVDTFLAAQAPATNSLELLMPMLATPIDKIKPSAIDWTTAYVQPKLDGHRALWKDGVLYSRQGKRLEIPHIIKAIENSPLVNLHLDGELYIHGRSLQALSTLIKKYTFDSHELEYHIYDMIDCTSFNERISLLTDELVDTWRGNLTIVETVPVNNPEQLDRHHTAYRGAGYEGTMLRFGTDGYDAGKRSRTLLKVKEFHDAEYEVVSVVEGKPTIRNGQTWQVPVWVCAVGNGLLFNVTAQGDMAQKDGQWQHREKFMGKQLTVKYHYLSKDGVPQLPIALRWHETV